MGFLSKILGSGEVAGKILGTVERFAANHLGKKELKLAETQLDTEIRKLLIDRDSEIEETLRAELGAKERVLVAELAQGDNFTKRARPSVVYAGLAFVGINYVAAPLAASMFSVAPPVLELPTEFWAAWGGIVATWSIGRSAEKRGVSNKFTQLATGSGGGLLNL